MLHNRPWRVRQLGAVCRCGADHSLPVDPARLQYRSRVSSRSRSLSRLGPQRYAARHPLILLHYSTARVTPLSFSCMCVCVRARARVSANTRRLALAIASWVALLYSRWCARPRAFVHRYDYLDVRGRRFSGTVGPHGVEVPGGSIIQWHSDMSVASGGGLMVCASTTMPGPTPPEQVSHRNALE